MAARLACSICRTARRVCPVASENLRCSVRNDTATSIALQCVMNQGIRPDQALARQPRDQALGILVRRTLPRAALPPERSMARLGQHHPAVDEVRDRNAVQHDAEPEPDADPVPLERKGRRDGPSLGAVHTHTDPATRAADLADHQMPMTRGDRVEDADPGAATAPDAVDQWRLRRTHVDLKRHESTQRRPSSRPPTPATADVLVAAPGGEREQARLGQATEPDRGVRRGAETGGHVQPRLPPARHPPAAGTVDTAVGDQRAVAGDP